jgi:vacuolar-type H+-ATPase subunit E/Vma4
MDTTFKTIKNEMKTFAQKPEYKETLLRMVSYAKNTLGPDIVIHCREGDRSVLGAMSVPTIGSSIDTSGGIIAEDNEGKKELDLTFEELLRTSEDRVKGFLLEKMVVEQQR